MIDYGICFSSLHHIINHTDIMFGMKCGSAIFGTIICVDCARLPRLCPIAREYCNTLVRLYKGVCEHDIYIIIICA